MKRLKPEIEQDWFSIINKSILSIPSISFNLFCQNQFVKMIISTKIAVVPKKKEDYKKQVANWTPQKDYLS